MNYNSNEMASDSANTELTSHIATPTGPSTIAVIFPNLHHLSTIHSSATVTNELRENSSVSPGSATIPSLSNGIQMASNSSNESPVGSTQPQLSYSLPNGRPPGTYNINHGYESDTSKDLKEADPPSYEEAIRAMEYNKGNPPPRVVNDNFIYHQYPDNGQLGVQDQYFYPQPYNPSISSDVDIELRKAVCARMVSCIVLIGFMALAIRIIFFIQ